MSTEKERETQVYMAKLAEQAERYDGISFFHFFGLNFSLFGIFLLFQKKNLKMIYSSQRNILHLIENLKRVIEISYIWKKFVLK